MLLEFAALSRVTGNPEYEEKAHRAMEVIWQKRNEHHHLVGNVINVTSGEWINKGVMFTTQTLCTVRSVLHFVLKSGVMYICTYVYVGV